jgi:hypothetical protein
VGEVGNDRQMEEAAEEGAAEVAEVAEVIV